MVGILFLRRRVSGDLLDYSASRNSPPDYECAVWNPHAAGASAVRIRSAWHPLNAPTHGGLRLPASGRGVRGTSVAFSPFAARSLHQAWPHFAHTYARQLKA